MLRSLVSSQGRRPLGEGRFAFSLVEVVIAIGLFVFVALGIVGLLTVAIDAEKASSSFSALSQMSRSTRAYLNAQGFSAVASNYSASKSIYFDKNGQMELDANGVPFTSAQSDSFYECSIQSQVNPLVSTNRLKLRMVFFWPVSASASGRQSNTISASMSNRQ